MAPSTMLTVLLLAIVFSPMAHFYAIDLSTTSPLVAPEEAKDVPDGQGATEFWFSLSEVDNNGTLPPDVERNNRNSSSGLQEYEVGFQPYLLENDTDSSSSLSSAKNSVTWPCNDQSEGCRNVSNQAKFNVKQNKNSNDTVSSYTTSFDTENWNKTALHSNLSEKHDVILQKLDRTNRTDFTSSTLMSQSSSMNSTDVNINTTTAISKTVVMTTTVLTTKTTTTLATTPTTPKPRRKPPLDSSIRGNQKKKHKGHKNTGKKTISTAKTSVSGQTSHHLPHHFTGFVQHVWLPNSTPRPPGPVDDGPFGSILWRDKKYLISVLIPIGVGFAGAMMIIVMAYASRAWRKRKERQAHAQGAPGSFLEAASSKNDDMAPLQESSDDEF